MQADWEARMDKKEAERAVEKQAGREAREAAEAAARQRDDRLAGEARRSG